MTWKSYIVLTLIVITSINMGDMRKEGTNLGPRFTPLEANQGNYRVTVHDGKSSSTVTQFCLGGYTSLPGIRCEEDDSTREFNFANISSITIEKPTHQSPQFRDKEFTLISITTLPGNKTVTNLLVDPQVTIAGIDVETHAKFAWFIKNINKIVFHHEPAPKHPPSSRSSDNE